jgi:PAS domain S-box-containing protein
MQGALPARVGAQTVWRAVAVWMLLMAVAGLVAWLLYRTQVDANRSVIEVTQRHQIGLAAETITSDLGAVRSDLLYLADQPLLKNWLDTGAESARRELAADYLDFVRRKHDYDQLRLIDARGRERVRINWNGGHPDIVPAGALQHKGQRYYVRDSLRLKRNAVYVSPFDLNVEHGKVQSPPRPMIRFATPVFDSGGSKRGIVVLNYLGRHILDQLRRIGSQEPGTLWLLNADGYWLLGPRSADDWGFMFPARANRTFGRRYPAVWHAISSSGGHGDLVGHGGLFTYRKIAPQAFASGDRLDKVGTRREWILVGHVSAAQLSSYGGHLAELFGWAYAAVGLFLAAVVSVVVHLRGRRLAAEQAMVRARARYQELVNNLTVGVYRNTGGPAGRFLEVNPAMLELFGARSREQLLGTPVCDLYAHPEERAAFAEKIGVQGHVIDAELELKRLDGAPFWASVTAVQGTDASGAAYLDGVLMDITARKQAQEALRASEASFRGLVEAAPDGVVITDRSGRIVLVNAQAEQMFGYNRDELIGQSVDILLPERFKGVHPAHRESYLQQPRSRPMGAGLDLWARRRDGTEFPVAISLSPIVTESGTQVFSAVRDVTARREVEERIQSMNRQLVRHNVELEAVNKELEAFSYSVSHDLRAPLRAIDGFGRILQKELEGSLEQGPQDHLNRVRRAAQHMGELIDDLLNLSRVTRSELVVQDVDLAEIGEAAIGRLREAHPDRRVRFLCGSHLQARGDPRLLQVALDNLLGNAWKFTAGRAQAVIELGVEDHKATPVYYVKDNGAGFDMAYADKLFGAFQRLHDSGEFAGTGIGLATVQRIIHKHGGRIWADGKVDQGATFYFALEPMRDA